MTHTSSDRKSPDNNELININIINYPLSLETYIVNNPAIKDIKEN